MSEPIEGHFDTTDSIPGDVEPVAMAAVADVRPMPITPPLRSVEDWAKRKKTPAWLFKAAVIGVKWECGPQVEPCLVTEAAFDRAIAFAENPHAVVNAPK